MAFSDILDQPMPVRLMQNSLRRDRVPNAMLFWGSGGVGKRLAAYELAKAINCEQGNADACGECLPCRKVAHGNHPDIHVTAPVKKSRVINVEAVSSIVELASLRPFESKWRIFLLHDADRMNGPAQNQLLKTLEEPPGQTLFILLSETPQALLPTIRSRCQMVRFGTLSPESVKQLLMRERNVDAALAESVAAISQGQMSRAFELIDGEKRDVVFSFIDRLNQGADPLNLSTEFAQYLAAEKAAIEASVKEQSGDIDPADLSKEDRERIKSEQQAVIDALGRRGTIELLYLMETWYRDKLVLDATQDARHVLNRDQIDRLEKSALRDLDSKLHAIEKARVYLERFLNEDRVFRDLFFVLAR